MEHIDRLFKCSVCKNRLPAASFYADSTRSAGNMSRCKKCDDMMRERRRERRIDGRKALINGAKTKPCDDCGAQYAPCAMDFDHRAGVEKRFNISSALRFSLVEIFEEIAKCDVVCAVCYRYRTQMRASREWDAPPEESTDE